EEAQGSEVLAEQRLPVPEIEVRALARPPLQALVEGEGLAVEDGRQRGDEGAAGLQVALPVGEGGAGVFRPRQGVDRHLEVEGAEVGGEGGEGAGMEGDAAAEPAARGGDAPGGGVDAGDRLGAVGEEAGAAVAGATAEVEDALAARPLGAEEVEREVGLEEVVRDLRRDRSSRRRQAAPHPAEGIPGAPGSVAKSTPRRFGHGPPGGQRCKDILRNSQESGLIDEIFRRYVKLHTRGLLALL